MKGTKIISVLLIAVMLISLGTTVFASFNPNAIITEVETKAESAPVDTSSVSEIAGNVVRLIRNVAVIAAVVLISIMGIKFMLGSAEERADYKKSFVPLIVGIVVVVAATQIATMLFSIA